MLIDLRVGNVEFLVSVDERYEFGLDGGRAISLF